MGLEQVIGEVRRDGDQRAKKLIDDAQAEASRILAAATEKVQAYEDERMKAATRDAEQARQQIRSGAEFEARKLVLRAEAELRGELRQAVLDGFATLPAATRAKHITALLATAKKTIPDGVVRGARQDAKALESQTTYKYGGQADIAGGIIVESANGMNRLDLSYETLIADMWRDVLKAEAGLFS